jgi:hypothetical protein
MDQIKVIHRSVSGFICGLFGLLPLVGLPFGIAAVVQFICVRRRRDIEWNPAERYLDWGAIFALIGFGLTLLVVAIALFNVINYSMHSSGGIYGLEE